MYPEPEHLRIRVAGLSGRCVRGGGRRVLVVKTAVLAAFMFVLAGASPVTATGDSCPPAPCVTQHPIEFSISHARPRAGATFTGEVIAVRQPGTIQEIRVTCGRGHVGERLAVATLRLYYPGTGRFSPSAATCSWRVPSSATGGSLVVAKTTVLYSDDAGNRGETGWERASWKIAR
jgi:hypothetical protein